MLNRLSPVNFINDMVYASDDSYVYGQGSNRFAARWSLAEINAGAVATKEIGHSFGTGNEVKGVWTIASGHKFYLVEVSATGQYGLWRSDFTDDASWASGTFTKIFDFGDDQGSPFPDMLVLQDGFVEVEINGVKSILIYEYNVNQNRVLGGANDPVRILQSTDNGATFSTLITFNTVGHQLKHGHTVAQNPVTNTIYFGSGDSGAIGTADCGQAIIAWDGVAAFPADNTLPADFDALSGFSSVANVTESRTVSFLFDDAGFVYTGTDANTSAALGGIWRWASDLSSRSQVDNTEAQFSNHTMWYAAQQDGVHYWTDDVSGTTVVDDGHFNIYASDTPDVAGSYRIIGRITAEDAGTGFVINGSPASVFFAGGKLFISSSQVAGKSYSQTAIIEITSERWKDQIDIVAPAIYVDPINGSDTNSGWYPADALKSVRTALIGSTISHGTSIHLSSDASDASFSSLDWSAYSFAGAGNGPVNAPVQLRGKGRNTTSYTVTGNANTFYWARDNHSLEIYDLKVRNTSTSNSEIFNIGANDCSILVSDSWIGEKSDPNRIYRCTEGIDNTATAVRSLHQGSDARLAIQKGGSATGYTFTGIASIFDGFDNISLADNDSDFAFYNCSLLNWKPTKDGLDSGTSLTVAPRYLNNALYQPSSGISINVSNGAQPVLDVESNYNIANTATAPVGYQGTSGSIQDPLLNLTTYEPEVGSPVIGAGTDAGVVYDYKGNLYNVSSPSVGAIEGNPIDTDGDGVGDFLDAFPNDPNETLDSDGDGVGDNADAFPNDPTETLDSDGDGVGDNADAFPNDPTQTGGVDTDGDGVDDSVDAFPNDPNETLDSDGDGIGDNADAFPNDASETLDSDGDGVGDNADAFPNDPNETLDSDGDGVGDNADAFPNDPNETLDSDGDGIGDNADLTPNPPVTNKTFALSQVNLDDYYTKAQVDQAIQDAIDSL